MHYRMLLHPLSDQPPSEQALQTLFTDLHDLGFLGSPMPGHPDRFLPGPQLLQLITFLGCSPALPLAPPQPGSLDFCHLRSLGPFPEPLLHSCRHTKAPRCPLCRRAKTGWQSLDLRRPSPCPHCHELVHPRDLDWRQTAALTRYGLEIFHIFPHEAIPTPGLLNSCHKATGTPWHYAYLWE